MFYIESIQALHHKNGVKSNTFCIYCCPNSLTFLVDSCFSKCTSQNNKILRHLYFPSSCPFSFILMPREFWDYSVVSVTWNIHVSLNCPQYWNQQGYCAKHMRSNPSNTNYCLRHFSMFRVCPLSMPELIWNGANIDKPSKACSITKWWLGSFCTGATHGPPRSQGSTMPHKQLIFFK